MSKFVIISKNTVYQNLLFNDIYSARNFIKMNNPRRKFKEEQENIFICKNYGTRFTIIKLVDHIDQEQYV